MSRNLISNQGLVTALLLSIITTSIVVWFSLPHQDARPLNHGLLRLFLRSDDFQNFAAGTRGPDI